MKEAEIKVIFDNGGGKSKHQKHLYKLVEIKYEKKQKTVDKKQKMQYHIIKERG